MKKVLLFLAFFGNLIVILSFWWLNSGPLLTSGDTGSMLIALGRVLGLLVEFMILVQLMLIGRVRFIEQLFGFDKLNRIHRTLGIYIVCTLIFHPTLLILGYAISGNVSLISQFFDFIYNWEDVFKAFLGFLILLTAVGISISIIRKKLKYETWYFSHLFIYLAIILFFGHQVNTAESSDQRFYYYWYTLNFIIFGLVICYRFVRPLFLAFRYTFEVEKVVQENALITSVYITGNNIASYKFQAGQYVHVTFLTKGMWYTHPFSLSAAPNGKHLRLSIKSSGDFTSNILSLKPGTKMIIDGPFGIFTEKSAKTQKFLFIAAGIGITPIYAMIESMVPKKTDMVLLYGNRNLSEAAFIPDLQKLEVKMHTFLSQEQLDTYEYGRIDQEKILRLVPDVAERDVYVCGPAEMIENTVISLKALGVPPQQIHFERFGY